VEFVCPDVGTPVPAGGADAPVWVGTPVTAGVTADDPLAAPPVDVVALAPPVDVVVLAAAGAVAPNVSSVA
jgi:hypothetical protein